MKRFYSIVLVILNLIITQHVFPQNENTKGPLTGEQQIELSEGYSFISSRIVAENPDMQDVLQSNLANLEFVRNSAGLMLRKIGPNWVNSIGDWVSTEGYLFKMSSADNLIITGDVIDPQTPIALSIGYQMIGYLPDQALNTEDVFQDVLENIEFVRNTAGLMLRKIGPNWVNSIGDMLPGEGYLVKMLANDVLIYPGSSSFTCGDPFTDPRDGQSYNTVLIGGQCWMAESLNIGTMINGSENMSNDGIIEKYCYDNDPANCEIYGGLYKWSEMMEYTFTQGVQGICPTGWHLPTDDEWKILEGTVDSQYPVGDPIWNNIGYRGFDAGVNLKSTSGWIFGGNGSGLYDFEMHPCGSRGIYGDFNHLTIYAYFWSSTKYMTSNAYHRKLDFDSDKVARYNIYRGYGLSVRCLKGDFTPVNQPPVPPSTPTPEDGSEYQTIEVDLLWTCTDPDGDPLTYDIYLGTETPPPLVATGQTETTYDPGTLEIDIEYFWKIIAHDDHSHTTEGPVWGFTTGVNNPPEPPASPSPENGAVSQPIEPELSWTCTDPEGDPLTYDIYFGTVNPPPLVYSGQALTTYYPGILEYNTEYFWKIVAHDNHNNATVGPVWNFITETEQTPQPCPGIPTVTYEGQVYNTILIGEQCWLKENLNVGTMINGTDTMKNNGVIEKYCYGNNIANCNEYGAFYQWNELMQYTTTPGVQGICPAGWHVPTDDEWKILEGTADSQYPVGHYIWGYGGSRGFDVGLNLKSTSGWNDNGNGTDLYGFTVLSGGDLCNGNFGALGEAGLFWTSTESYLYTDLAWYRIFRFDSDKVTRWDNSKDLGLSVRCLMNVNQPPNPPELPIPEDGSENQPIEPELSWDCTDPDGDPLTYDIYFGTVNPPPLVYSNQPLTDYYPGILETDTEYFWSIVAHDNHNNSTSGPIWSFTTGSTCPGIPTVTYEGQVYNTVLIGEQCWLKENLNVGTMIISTAGQTNNGVIEKYCYGTETANCDEYGGLYQWDEMMQYTTTPGVQGICPSGWHIPTNGELTILTDYLGGIDVAGGKMKETDTTHWNPPNTGATNESGFTALGSGKINSWGFPCNLKRYTHFWSSSENNNYAWYLMLYYDSDEVNLNNYDKIFGYSVRCVKDEN